jgi:hypothetical protein
VCHTVHHARFRCAAERDKDDVSWDDAWSKFKKSAKLPDMSKHVDRPLEGNSSQSRSKHRLTEQEKQIRRQESTLLNVWTQQGFFLLCGCTVLLLLVLFVSAGAPPKDPRCMLPWC